jgi:S-adenosylmethionine hydrolase
MSCVTLTTDFGEQDWFVGVMKGVLAVRAPQARVVDLTHGIAPGDVRAAAFALLNAYPYFPRRTVHLVVVDPGVGSARRGLAVRTTEFDFIAPDNGVLSWALERERIRSVRWIENEDLRLQPASATFHGRDIFAPAAAFLAAGGAFDRLGPLTDSPLLLPWSDPSVVNGGWVGEVVYVDRFGNAITNLHQPLSMAEPVRWLLHWAPGAHCALETCYSAVGKGEPVAVVGSCGFLEIAVNQGRASDQLGLKIGDRVELRPDRTTARPQRKRPKGP